MRRIVIAALALALSSACGKSDQDQLVRAHDSLKPAPCNDQPSVAGISSVNGDPHQVYVGDWVVIAVCHIDTLMDAAAAGQKPVTLYINGMDTLNEPTGVDRDRGRLTFLFERTPRNKDLWKPLLYDPVFDRYATVYASIGISGEKQLPRSGNANMLLQLNKLYIDWTSYLFFGVLFLVLCVLLFLARTSDMLRDGPAVAGARRPYSLARSQMAWWFFLVLVAYVFIWMVTGDQDTIPTEMLGMLGISAVTAVAAVTIGSTDQLQKRRSLYDDEIAAVDAARLQIVVDLGEAATRTDAHAGPLRDALQKRVDELDARKSRLLLERANLSPTSTSAGWWRDLVRDERGAFALDRLQVVVWTVVTGGIFIYTVLWQLTMPEFSTTLLALMGISAGTYIGFQLPGAKS